MKRSHSEHMQPENDQTQAVGQAGSSTGPGTASHSAHPLPHRPNPLATPFTPAIHASTRQAESAIPAASARRVRPRLGTSPIAIHDDLPELSEGDEWVMVDSVWCFELLGWETVSYIDTSRPSYAYYVVGVSANQIAVGIPELDAFKAMLTKEEPDVGGSETDWMKAVYEKYRPAGLILDLSLIESEQQSSSPYLRLTFETPDAVDRALRMAPIVYAKEGRPVTSTAVRVKLRGENEGWGVAPRSQLRLLYLARMARSDHPRSGLLTQLLARFPALMHLATDATLASVLVPKCRRLSLMDWADRTTTFFHLPGAAPKRLRPIAVQVARSGDPFVRGSRSVMPEPNVEHASRRLAEGSFSHFVNDDLRVQNQSISAHARYKLEKYTAKDVLANYDLQQGIMTFGASRHWFAEQRSGWALPINPVQLEGPSRLACNIAAGVLESAAIRESIVKVGPHRDSERQDQFILRGISQSYQEDAYRARHKGQTSFPCLKIGYVDDEDQEMDIGRYQAEYAPKYSKPDALEGLKLAMQDTDQETEVDNLEDLGLPPLPDSPSPPLPPLPDSPPPSLPLLPTLPPTTPSSPPTIPAQATSLPLTKTTTDDEEIDWELYAADEWM